MTINGHATLNIHPSALQTYKQRNVYSSYLLRTQSNLFGIISNMQILLCHSPIHIHCPSKGVHYNLAIVSSSSSKLFNLPCKSLSLTLSNLVSSSSFKLFNLPCKSFSLTLSSLVSSSSYKVPNLPCQSIQSFQTVQFNPVKFSLFLQLQIIQFTLSVNLVSSNRSV